MLKVLTRSEEIFFARTDRQKLVLHNFRLVTSTAKLFVGKGLPYEDLLQEGYQGLIKAAERFDPSRGFKFGTYAMWWIRQYMRRATQEQTRVINIPVWLSDRISKIKKHICIYRAKHGQLPSFQELSDIIGLKVAQIEEALGCKYEIPSLDEVLDGQDGSTMDSYCLSDCLIEENSVTDKQAEISGRQQIVRKFVSDNLSPREALVLVLFFGLDEGGEARTQGEVAEILGDVSPQGVSGIITRALGKLRKAQKVNELYDIIDL